MAAKTKKQAVRKAAKRPAKKATNKAASRKTPAKPKLASKGKTKKKSWLARAVSDMGGLLTGKRKAKSKAAGREIGEGNYAASKRFRDKEEAFIKRNKAKIPKLAKAAETALDGPEGNELRAAEASTAARGKGMER